MSNRLFRESAIGEDLPCQNCNLIEMGSMACYQEFCPECGKIPPNRDVELEFVKPKPPVSRSSSVEKKNPQNVKTYFQSLKDCLRSKES